MAWKVRSKNSKAENRGNIFPEAARFSRGTIAFLSLLLLLPALTSCVATRKSNLGPAAINSFTGSVWDNNNVADISPAEQNPTINPGENIVLSWNVSGAVSISIGDGTGSLQNPTVLSGNRIVVAPTVSTTYTLTVTGVDGTISTFNDGTPAAVTVTVLPPPVVSSFTAATTNILSGQSTTLSWSVANAAALTLYAYDPANFGKPGDTLFGTQNVTGMTSFEVSPTVPTEYELYATYQSDGTGFGGTPEATLIIQVQAVPVPGVTLFATPTSILPGSSSTLSWTVTNSQYVTNLTLQAVDANHPPPGIQTDVTTAPDLVVTPSITTTYSLVATNLAGVQATSNPVVVDVTSCPVPTISQFSSDPVSAPSGATANLTAVFAGGVEGDAGTGTIDNGIGAVTSGVPITTSALTASTTFHLTVTNHCGSTATAMTRVPIGNVSYFGGNGLGLYFGLINDASGNLYSASDLSYEGCIFEVSSAGSTRTIAGSPDGQCDTYGWVDGPINAALFNDPTGLAIDPSNNLYITDSLNNAIRQIALPTGTVSTLAGNPNASSSNHFEDGQGENALFYRPTGVVRDAQGNLYIADTGNNVIRRMDVNQNVTTIAGLGPSISNATGGGYLDGTGRAALFNAPNGITLGPDGNLYVVDSGNNVVRKVTLPGYVVTTIAGQASQFGYSDGPGTSALFASIAAITSDGDGNLYVPDSSHYDTATSTALNNYVIRRIRPQSDGSFFVDTIVGDPSSVSFIPNGSLPGNFKIDGAGILADSATGYLYITAGQGIYQAPY